MIFDNLEGPSNVGNNYHQIKEYIREGIKETIRNLLPFHEILDQSLYSQSESNSEPGSDPDSSSGSESELESSGNLPQMQNLNLEETVPTETRNINNIIPGDSIKDVYSAPELPDSESSESPEEEIRQVKIGGNNEQKEENTLFENINNNLEYNSLTRPESNANNFYSYLKQSEGDHDKSQLEDDTDIRTNRFERTNEHDLSEEDNNFFSDISEDES